ncbi:protein of unknown function (plasmid) [Cupriavidus taiwanensis]|uniref:Uncharacterized protein n=1 Tax=Cupriavidus taiwanensis TaxID=164546 RepID=A0A375ISF3_9BURK|nr:protein of unknown function [Cupriavidus taiwanensis]
MLSHLRFVAPIGRIAFGWIHCSVRWESFEGGEVSLHSADLWADGLTMDARRALQAASVLSTKGTGTDSGKPDWSDRDKSHILSDSAGGGAVNLL